MKKIIISKTYNYVSLFLLFVFLFINNCGIEDESMYFQEPRNLEIKNNSTTNVEVYFYGYNQEEDDDEYLFIGYDVYYYFTDSKAYKKAAVKNPEIDDLSHDTALIDFRDLTEDAYRFPTDKFSDSYMEDFYQYVTIPVTHKMIDDILNKGNNDNVRFCFHNHAINDETSDTNPYMVTADDYIYIDQIYPNYYEYKDKDWGENDNDFIGFYDQDYYDEYNIEKVRDDGGYYYYEICLWIIAKGSNSQIERTKDSYTESIKSELIKIELKVDPVTDNYAN